MTDPTVSFVPGSPVVGKPFVLVFEVDDDRARDGVVYLSEEQLTELLAAGERAQVEHFQHDCVHDEVQRLAHLGIEPWPDGRELARCCNCRSELVIEADGVTLVRVGGAR